MKQKLEPQDIFKAFWDMCTNKPEPTGKLKEIMENEEEELLFQLISNG